MTELEILQQRYAEVCERLHKLRSTNIKRVGHEGGRNVEFGNIEDLKKYKLELESEIGRLNGTAKRAPIRWCY